MWKPTVQQVNKSYMPFTSKEKTTQLPTLFKKSTFSISQARSWPEWFTGKPSLSEQGQASHKHTCPVPSTPLTPISCLHTLRGEWVWMKQNFPTHLCVVFPKLYMKLKMNILQRHNMHNTNLIFSFLPGSNVLIISCNIYLEGSPWRLVKQKIKIKALLIEKLLSVHSDMFNLTKFQNTKKSENFPLQSWRYLSFLSQESE